MKSIFFKKLFLLIFCFQIISIFSFSACTIKYYDTNKLINDFKTEGFLDRDHYQIIFRGFPDKNARGLVAQRESAYSNAVKDMNQRIIDNLVKYSINYILNKQKTDVSEIENFNEIEEKVTKKMQDLLQYGYTAFEYYNEDNSAVVVYRIFKDELIKKIEDDKIKFKMKSKEPENQSSSHEHDKLPLPAFSNASLPSLYAKKAIPQAPIMSI